MLRAGAARAVAARLRFMRLVPSAPVRGASCQMLCPTIRGRMQHSTDDGQVQPSSREEEEQADAEDEGDEKDEAEEQKEE